MLCRKKIVWCVLGAAALAWSAGASWAETVTVYNANDAMYDSETGSSPAASFGGVWSVGTRAAAADTAFTLFDVAVGDANYSGWASAADWLPDVVVNVSGGPVGTVSAKGFHFHPTGDGATEYAVLRWTAPEAGTADISTAFWALSTGITDIHIIHNGASIWSSGLNAAGGIPSANASLSGITVAASDVIDVCVGNYNGDIAADATGVLHSVTLTVVPEPSCVAILASAMIGLLAYAWRRRR